MQHEQPIVPESVSHLVEVWKTSDQVDVRALAFAKLRYGKAGFETVELMNVIKSLNLDERDKEDMESMLGLVSLSDLPMERKVILSMIGMDAEKAELILDTAEAFKAKVKDISDENH